MRVTVLLITVTVLLVAVCADELSMSSDTTESTTTTTATLPTTTHPPPATDPLPKEKAAELKDPFPTWAIILVVLGIIIPFLIIVIVAVIWRRRMMPCCKDGDEDGRTPAKQGSPFLSRTPFSKTPETRVYLEPNHFEHKGPLSVQNETPLELKPQINKDDEKVVASPNAHFKFAEEPGAHVVYDIGSDVEQVQ